MRSSHKFWFHVFFLFWPERQRREWGEVTGRKERRKEGREGGERKGERKGVTVKVEYSM